MENHKEPDSLDSPSRRVVYYRRIIKDDPANKWAYLDLGVTEVWFLCRVDVGWHVSREIHVGCVAGHGSHAGCEIAEPSTGPSIRISAGRSSGPSDRAESVEIPAIGDWDAMDLARGIASVIDSESARYETELRALRRKLDAALVKLCGIELELESAAHLA